MLWRSSFFYKSKNYSIYTKVFLWNMPNLQTFYFLYYFIFQTKLHKKAAVSPHYPECFFLHKGNIWILPELFLRGGHTLIRNHQNGCLRFFPYLSFFFLAVKFLEFKFPTRSAWGQRPHSPMLRRQLDQQLFYQFQIELWLLFWSKLPEIGNTRR